MSNLPTSYVCSLDPEQIRNLKFILSDKGWEMGEVPHAYYRAKMNKTTIVAYNSGKLTVQGKGTPDFVTFILEPEILKEVGFGYDNVDLGSGEVIEFQPHAGIDESGKGDFFGPLVVACVYVAEGVDVLLKELGAKDSKVIKSDKKITYIASEIRKLVGGNYSTVAIGPEAYNRTYSQIGNLNKLLAWGHSRALENLLEKAPECNDVLADKFGNESLIKNALLERGKKVKLRQQTKAESDIAVAAASILARDEFIRGMKRMGDQFNYVFPRGASAKVLEIGSKFIEEFGRERLNEVGKMHFKTADKILNP
jgi:ribonuclease HIII